MAAKQTMVVPYWAVLMVIVTFAFTETAIIVDKSSSLTPALGKNRVRGPQIGKHLKRGDDKGSSSASEDFIDLDASPSHVLHDVVDGSKESEMGDGHDSMPLQRPKTTIEVDSDETDDVIHSGSGDDLETLDLEKNGEKNEDESSGSGSGSGESQCNENNCKYGGVCDLDAEDPQCICDFGCKKKEKNPSNSVCGSDSILYSDICVMKWTSCIQQKPITQKSRSFCIKQKPQQENCTEHDFEIRDIVNSHGLYN